MQDVPAPATEPTHLQQGMITILVDLDQKSVRPALITLISEYQEIIHTSFSARMAGELGLEIILVRGDSARIRSLEQQITTKRGVRSARLNVIPT